MADTRTIDSVTTFVAELPGEPVQKVLAEKFQGNKTWRTLSAARRIAAKKCVVKVPRNLMRQLWRITGGWQAGYPQVGWGNNDPTPSTDRRGNTTYWKAVTLGELTAIFNPGSDYAPCVLLYRGMQVGRIADWNGWVSRERALGAAKALGVDWKPQANNAG